VCVPRTEFHSLDEICHRDGVMAADKLDVLADDENLPR
jgi:hypothetical protein